MKALKTALFYLIPIAFLAFLLFYNPRVAQNNRQQTDQEEQTAQRLATFESRLADETAFELVTRDNITEVETEILLESNIENPAEVQPNDTVRVNYRGWRASDAFVFDQSFLRGDEGTVFGLNQVIAGWGEGLVGMKEGEVRRIFIPSELAYGEAGQGADIPPNEDLIFDVELIQIEN